MSDPPPAASERVSTLELFFDLVFVFVITQVAHLVTAGHGVTGLLQAALVLLVTWWMYGGYAWLTNNVGTRSPLARLLLLCGMAGFLVMALSAPRAFGSGGLAFGLAYLLVVGIHAALFTRAPGGSARAILGIAPFNFGMALALLAAAFAPPAWRTALWGLALALIALSTLLRRDSGFEVNPAHFAERHGLVILIALGESIVALGSGAGETGLGRGALLAALLGLALAAGLWWSYFDRDDEQAGEALARLSGPARARAALTGYSYAHVVMIGGIVLVAAGLGEVVGHHEGERPGAAAWWLGAGLALYLAGDVWFRRTLGIGRGGVRALAAGLALGCVPLGLWAGGLWQLAALALLLALMLLAEA